MGSVINIFSRLMWSKRFETKGVSNNSEARLCKGGNSWNCNHKPHKIGRNADIVCYRCNARLGCSACVRVVEVICLSCHNYGHRLGIKKHGNIIPSIKCPRVRTDAGWQRWQASADPVSDLVNQVIC